MGNTDRKNEILDAALACFDEFGVDGTTIDAIRVRSGASTGSVYHHFGNKEGIAAALLESGLAAYHLQQADALAAAANAQDGVKAIVRAYIDWVATNPELARFILSSRRYVDRSRRQDGEPDENRQRALVILNWFRPYIEDGKVKKLPIECYASLVLGPAHDYARNWLAGRTKKSIRLYRDIFAEAAWDAVKPSRTR